MNRLVEDMDNCLMSRNMKMDELDKAPEGEDDLKMIGGCLNQLKSILYDFKPE
ncbi:MAG: hypothetical protein JRI28_06325 [Deltaproteobacteria bacterium]|nr:hypothetical protein [Deltaproteobacteria bacterium]